MTRLFAALVLALCALIPLRSADRPPVKVTGGLVSGAPAKDAAITVFKGVPFAAPPVGELRWRAPAPVVKWDGVRKAEAFGTSCVQTIVPERKPWTYEFMTHTEVSEDCLYLNVWTPARLPRERRPVYVFIHGGGNTEGSGAVPVYNGTGLAKKGIVVVTLNYRLGVFGLFTHPELTKESQTRSSGNYALLDLVAGLRWVRDNIAAFGGDPYRVTVGGQSAGAANVHSLTASPLARGLFHRAIAESGSSVTGGPMGTRTLAEQEQLGLRWAEAKGARSLEALRALSWKELLVPVPVPAIGTAPPPASMRFGVVVDGHVLPATVADAFAQGKQHDVPTLTGCNADENGAMPRPEIVAEAFQKQARQRFGDLAEDFLRLYPAANDDQARASQNDSARDQARVSMYLWAAWRAKTSRTKAFTYFWTHPMPGPDVDRFGAFHTSEVPFVMSTLAMSNRPFTDADHKLADQASSYWTNFIAMGDPNGRGLPEWPVAGAEPPTTFEMGRRTGPVPVAGSAAKLAFFERFFSKSRPTTSTR